MTRCTLLPLPSRFYAPSFGPPFAKRTCLRSSQATNLPAATRAHSRSNDALHSPAAAESILRVGIWEITRAAPPTRQPVLPPRVTDDVSSANCRPLTQPTAFASNAVLPSTPSQQRQAARPPCRRRRIHRLRPAYTAASHLHRTLHFRPLRPASAMTIGTPCPSAEYASPRHG